jgi:hypothetical protein
MDVTSTVRDIAAVVIPVLPLLQGMGTTAAQEAAKKFGTDAWELAKLLWGKLKPAIEKTTASRTALQEALDNPEDPDFQAALRISIRKLLEADTVLAKELSDLLQEPVHKAGIVQAHQYVSGNYNATADRGSTATVSIGKVSSQ